MNFQAGSLVHARGRDWLVQPGSDSEFLLLKPLGGRDEEETGILLGLEDVKPASFGLPDPEATGDARSARLLRDAARLSFRAGTGPFRSFARIAVEPRPYQLVPLLMALKLDPVRLLIADDVGIGKTVESLLIARELLDRGEIKRFSILCPPHLADQWQTEMRDKFHLDAVLVLPATVRRLERGLGVAESVFDRHPFTIVSTDFIKSERRRSDFLRAAPELVIVDEAHTGVDAGIGRGGRHQRHELLKGLVKDAGRHLLLVTATPHSGNEDAFRALLALLNRDFADLPADLTGQKNEKLRRELARYFVQRKRGDIRSYLGAETDFPERDEDDEPYSLSEESKQLFSRVLAFAREELRQGDGSHRQRIRWWAILGLLRALASSPAAAAATLRNRAAPADTETVAEADEVGRRTVLDLPADDASDAVDVTPGSHVEGEQASSGSARRLNALAKEAEKLQGLKHDLKLKKLHGIVKKQLADGHSPIVFCRFIDTADYVAGELRDSLGRNTEVVSVTGSLPPAEREARVEALAGYGKRVLVATDCLSEGINLQDHFDSVIHYDLSWNPTRHEQREGRVDRYGQPRSTVLVRTMYGLDNQIDGVVLDVLLRKHRAIRTSLGISVPVPAGTDEVVEAIFEGLLLRGQSAGESQQGALFENLDDYLKPRTREFSRQWDAAADRERRSRTMFAQETIKVDEVAREVSDAREAGGSSETVERFLKDALTLSGGTAATDRYGATVLDYRETPAALQDAVGVEEVWGRFALPVGGGEIHLSRTHPVTEATASFVLDTALDGDADSVAVRAGAMRTDVPKRTTVLLLRHRFHVTTRRGSETWQTLAEETRIAAWTGAGADRSWLEDEEARAMLDREPTGNILPAQARQFISRALTDVQELEETLTETARQRAAALLDAHRRVRTASGAKGLRYSVEPLLPVDVLGVYVFVPGKTA